MDAVIDALGTVGLSVTDMDEVWSDGDKRGDLRVKAPEAAGWEAVCEVRGYKGGAKVIDLARLQRFAQRYQTDEGHEAPACWYIVNGMIGDDPASRHEPLRENPDEIAFSAQEYRGLVIDTRDLYRLVRDIQLGEISDSAAPHGINRPVSLAPRGAGIVWACGGQRGQVASCGDQRVAPQAEGQMQAVRDVLRDAYGAGRCRRLGLANIGS